MMLAHHEAFAQPTACALAILSLFWPWFKAKLKEFDNMPCDTITTTKLDAGKMQPGLFMDALRRNGHNPRQIGDTIQWGYDSYNIKTGQLSTRGDAQKVLSNAKSIYSAEIVYNQAKRFGWTVKKLQNGQLQIQKR